ncbi:GNAT family N-acetyltransferase [Rhodococcus sp. 06-1460-1B]|nr:GNAT family N-acetyltransferase [Rhodococcus fascians]MBY4112675.1 GNAT family N-acetyltransferase [Rhodococcus fascians]OZD59109.1 GNAT family N-acetyltransferase [Rhodococcus sp. 06-1460-1B]
MGRPPPPTDGTQIGRQSDCGDQAAARSNRTVVAGREECRRSAVSVREAGPADAHRVADLAALTFPLACPPGTQPGDIETFISNVLSAKHFETYIADPNRTVLLDESAEAQVLGYAMLVFGTPTDSGIRSALSHEPTVEISKLYVRPTEHGGGVAARLMTSALDSARRHGCGGAWLGVNQQNVRAQKFYAKHGFEVAGTKTFVVGDRTHDDYVMQVQL